ncbi:MAG: hypothetical protein OXE84_11440 [Rhodobacteraceae bacterium]|nr:hypothetical protein [Paracoccaceae bacterium]MCY4197157.1 hypothetical protein [Paracoccaceae bacterium]
MKRLSLLTAAGLLASTPLFAMDGGGVSISGEANFGVKFKENDGGANAPNELQFHHEFDIKFSASGTTDGGIGFGGSVSIDNRESVSLATTPAVPGTLSRRWSAAVITEPGDNTAGAGLETGRDAVIIESADGIAEDSYYVNLNADGQITAIGRINDADGETPGADADGLGSRQFTVEVKEVSAGDGQERVVIAVVDGVPQVIEVGKDKSGWILARSATTALPATGVTLYQIGPGSAADGVFYHNAGTAASVALGPTDTHKVDNHGEVYISMDMHKLTIGTDLDRADQLAGGLADPGFDGIGIDDVAESVWADTARDVRYDGDFGVAKVAISYGDNKGDAEWAAGFSFNVDPVRFGAGFDSNGVMSIGMGFEQGLISMNALYSTDSDWHEADNEARSPTAAKSGVAPVLVKRDNAPDLKEQAMGVDLHYKMSDATSLVLVAAQSSIENAAAYYKTNAAGTALANAVTGTSVPANSYEQEWAVTKTTVDAFGVGFSHDLGGGATLKAGAGSVDSNAVADLGITMKF